MRKIGTFLGIFFSLFILSCEGPQGRDGLNGEDGSLFEAEAFQINVDMSYNLDDNTFEYLASSYSGSPTVLESDVVLIYRLEDVVDGTDVWRQLPQPVITDDGTFFFNFDFTASDYSIFIEPEFDATLISTEFTDDQWFRVVIVPAQILTSSKVDTSNISNVLNIMGVEESEIQKFQ